MTFDLHPAVEGLLDAAVVVRISREIGANCLAPSGMRGKDFLRKKTSGYCQAACFQLWVVLTDLDTTECAPLLLQRWGVQPAPFLCFRVAVRALEAWLLADRPGIARFLHIQEGLVPLQPEEETDPKRKLANLATHSRSSLIRIRIAPRAGSGRDVGPEYNSALSEFIQDGWSIQNAIQSAPSLAAAMECLRTLAKRVKDRS